jgi:CheY-like chemotaxis protein
MSEGLTALVVEDNQLNLDLALYVLEHAGWNVRWAMNAEQARAAMGGPVPDVILMDIQLPGIQGTTLAREFRQAPGFERVPIVALTAHAMRGDRERFLAEGFDGYIAKPIEVKTFAKQVAEFAEQGFGRG